MTISENTYFNNGVMGIPGAGVNWNTFGSSSTPQCAVGTLIERQDGARFRYGHFGADTTEGSAVAPNRGQSHVVVDAITVVAPTSAQTTTDGTIGYTYIEATPTNTPGTDSYAGGYLTVSNNTGEGFSYRIKGNTTLGNPASTTFRIELYSKLQASLSATSDIVITGSSWNNLQPVGDGNSTATGVSVNNVDASEKPYSWVQTKGIAAVLQDSGNGAVALGDPVTGSWSIDGSMRRQGMGTAQSYPTGASAGIVRGIDVTTGFMTVDLCIE